MSYPDSMSLIIQNAVIVMQLPPRLLWLPFLPKKIARVGKAIVAFKKPMPTVLNKERSLVSQRKRGAGNLMSSLVRASEEASQPQSRQRPAGLTNDELSGNMLIFNSAGHETTANTLSYGILLLAVNPIVHVGESIGVARQRILDMVTDRNMGFLLQIGNSTSVSVAGIPN